DIDSTDIAGWDVIREAIDRGVPVSKKALYEKLRIPQPAGKDDVFVKQTESYGFDDSFFLPTAGNH
ncbi:MAG TPA: hypothetical protein IAA30_02060, partial [Candidatus Treponema faecavium]|nr:hypothetical protein [Candidatus Treponema faecavium]